MVQQRAEGQPVPPGGGEVGDLHPAVVLGDLAAPGQQGLAGVGLPSQDRARDGAGLPAGEERKCEIQSFKNGSSHVRPQQTQGWFYLDHARSMTTININTDY